MPQAAPPRLAPAQPMGQTATYAPSHHVPSNSYAGGGGGGGSLPQYNTGAPTQSTLQNWANNQDCLDVYMVNAFYFGTAQRSQYPMSIWKTATCFGLQFIGIIILMQDQYAVWQSENPGSCPLAVSGNVAWIGYFFATYISLFCSEQIRTLNRYGMYGWGENQPNFVNPFWVGVGLWTNLVSLLFSWFVSVIIIFASPDLLEMILNAVAVTFLLTLDDEIIGPSDYNRILSWDGGSNSMCGAVDTVWAKIGGLLLKIHPCWQRRYALRGGCCVIECCDILLLPFAIGLPFIVLFCYSAEGDQLCPYEEAPELCVSLSI